jgi:hypothetical protein
MTGLNAFQYPAHPHRRRHGPQGYASAVQFREWLRDEFAFRCVYCLEREQWVHRTGHFHAEHFQPVALRPDLDLEYDNLVYACHVCNAIKQDRAVPNPLRVLLDGEVNVQPNGTLIARTKEAAKLIDLLHLNSFESRRRRRMVMRVIRLAADHDAALLQDMLGFPDDLPDLSRLHPPQGNRRPTGVKRSHFARRTRQKLPAVY